MDSSFFFAVTLSSLRWIQRRRRRRNLADQAVLRIFVQLLYFVQFLFRVCRFAFGLIQAAYLVVGIGQGGIECHGVQKRRLGLFIVFLLHVDRAQINVDDTQILLNIHRALEQRKRRVGMVVLPFNIREVGQSLGMIGVES